MTNKNVGYAVGTEITPLALSKEIQRLHKEEIKRLEAENNRLREALEKISNWRTAAFAELSQCEMARIANRALFQDSTGKAENNSL